ncbi:acyl-coenzyme A thioesterase PaaI-like protein [Geomicrobium halophilum]|uniref:Transcription factor FapR n=1 Tax=Geomicrobium halophilum TaxID=549000 RepID=A0A841PYN9_9BACL|nr:transcription factor FapR [Geomicrobium halophilum]MBB6449335.1 acyl-coenzyme A thioesterase PaaI-like protein [Geomicrobium halophilum]
MKQSKQKRKQDLVETIENNPFITDEALAKRFSVSVQTIRLDRSELGIPELRTRIKQVAETNHDDVKALTNEEIIGEIIDLQLDETAISILDIHEDQVFTRSGIARGHHLFAQANSLAVAIINDEFAVTGRANVRFMRQVQAGERVVAKASVTKKSDDWPVITVNSYVDQALVFKGEFVMSRG